MSGSLNFLRLFFVFIFCVILLAVSMACIIEVASRLSAFRYVESRTSEIEDRLARSLQGETSIDRVEPAFEIAQLAILRSISDDLSLLNFSGADRDNDTVSAIRDRLEDQLAAVAIQEQTQEVNQTISRLRAKLSTAANGVYLQSLLDELQQRFSIVSGDIRDEAQEAIGIIVRDGEATLDEFSEPSNQSDQPEVVYLLNPTEAITVSINRILSDFVTALDFELRDRLATSTFAYTESVARGIHLIDNPQVRFALTFYRFQPTDVLTAIAVILAGAIGAIAAATRRKNASYFRSVVTGFLAGFIALLIVKGGKSFFYVGPGVSQAIAINPYALAFAGVLAGLFTERAFEVLSKLVDELAERITSRNGDRSEQQDISQAKIPRKSAVKRTTSKKPPPAPKAPGPRAVPSTQQGGDQATAAGKT